MQKTTCIRHPCFNFAVYSYVPENAVLMKMVTSPLCSKETHENLRNSLKWLTSSIISPKGSQKCKRLCSLLQSIAKETQTRSDKCPLQPGLVRYTVSVIANLRFQVTRFAFFQSWECSHFFQLHLCCGQPVLSKTSADNLAPKKKQHISCFDRFDVIYGNLWSCYDLLMWLIRFVQSIWFKLFVLHRFTFLKLQCAKQQFFWKNAEKRVILRKRSIDVLPLSKTSLKWKARMSPRRSECSALEILEQPPYLSLKKHMDTSGTVYFNCSVLQSCPLCLKFLHSDNFPLCLASCYKSKRRGGDQKT